ncbi:unnamed protein product [Cuscuta campestris]|uniref:Uncharacterized protein n=1 Tax=Cuscuta campestris TaxID=132261 RepID=A0A484LM22_9ASTE|nr:unnamed protein product [Cuscuta campestris]
MPTNSNSTHHPPRIGKIGPYTVFITPPSTPSKPLEVPPVQIQPPETAVRNPPPVMVPPKQYDKYQTKTGSTFGVFWDAVAKVQNAHASLDENVAYWFGLNQSKYQWALDDYYESKGIDPAEARAKATPSKVENV